MKNVNKSLLKKVLLISISFQLILSICISFYFIYHSNERAQESLRDSVRQSVLSIFHSNEKFKQDQFHSELSRKIWEIYGVKGVNLYTEECQLLASTPINLRMNCKKEGLVISLTDQVSRISHIQINLSKLKNPYLVRTIINIGLIVLAFLVLTAFASYSIFIRYFKHELSNIVHNVIVGVGKNDDKVTYDGVPTEIQPLAKKVFERTKELKETQKELGVLNKEKALYQLSLKVSHDLRAPLAILKKHKETLDKGILENSIERLEDIANQLLKKNKSHTQLRIVHLNKVLSKVIEEKKELYPSTIFKKELKGDFVILGSFVELESILSNLINNSIEAGATEIKFSLGDRGDKVQLLVNDNGPGFSSSLLETDLSDFYSYGKDRGNGLGLKNAFEDLKLRGHALSISNANGASIEILFTKNLNGPIYLLEDELIFQMLWKEFFKKFDIDLKVFSKSDDLMSSLNDKDNNENVLFILDQELGEERKGIDISYDLYKRGYKNIILSTGYLDSIEAPNFILSVIGKEP